MSFPNVSDILATTIESRTKDLKDNVSNNNAILKKMEVSGRTKTFSGGHKIYQELTFAENSNAGWYSGYDLLPTAASDVISAAEFPIKQAAAPVVISGLEQLQNAGKEQMIDLMDGRLEAAEYTMNNLMAAGVYSDGTANGGKQMDGLEVAIPLDPTSGTYGGINRANWTFWRNQIRDVANTNAIQADMTTIWSNLVRGMDRPDLIMADNVAWVAYVNSLQAQQRFTSPEVGNLGFPTIKFMDADVCLDGGIGGNMPTGVMFFLNSKYLHYRPHANRNMVPLSPNKRYSTNQDAEVQIIGWAGNLTCSGAQFQGRLDLNA